MKNSIEDNNIKKVYLKLLPIQIFVSITSNLSSTINAIVVGRYFDSVAMIVLGLVTPLSAIISCVSIIISTGLSIYIGHAMGRGENEKIDSAYTSAILSLLCISILISVVCIIFPKPLALLCGASVDNLSSCIQYIQGLGVGIVGSLLVPCFMTILQMCNYSFFSLCMTILMAIFNYGLGIYNATVLKAGIFGISLMASISNYLVLIVILVFVFKKKIWHFKEGNYDFSKVRSILKLGFSSALVNIFYSLRNVFINNIALKIGGDNAINALSIVFSSCGVIDALNVGVFASYKMFASVIIGEEDERSLKILTRVALTYGSIVAIVKTILVFLFAEKIVALFGGVGEVAVLASRIYRIYYIAAPLNIFASTFIAIYVGMGKVFYANLLYLISALLVPVGLCLSLSILLGLDGIWLNYSVSEIVTLMVLYLIPLIQKKKWKLSFAQIFGLDDFPKQKDCINLAVNKMEDVVLVSQSIEDYCKEKNIDSRRSKFAALALEEMAGNIVDHGFHKDNKKDHSIDIYLTIKKGNIYLRVRDDCVPFDPHSKLGTSNIEDPCKNIGIKMIFQIAKDIHYQTTFGMNVLTIEL